MSFYYFKANTNLSLRFKKEKENTKVRSWVVHTVNAESHFFATLRLMVFSGKFYIPQKLFSCIRFREYIIRLM